MGKHTNKFIPLIGSDGEGEAKEKTRYTGYPTHVGIAGEVVESALVTPAPKVQHGRGFGGLACQKDGEQNDYACDAESEEQPQHQRRDSAKPSA